MSIAVLDPGPLTSVQTPHGRRGWRHLGVPVSGAADAWSARLANRLVGNADDTPLLEMTLSGASLRFDADAVVALTGARFVATMGATTLPHDQAFRVGAGSGLRIGEGAGARAYLAVAGGIVTQPVLGSCATDLRSGFGGHAGRSLAAGDVLHAGKAQTVARRLAAQPRAADGPIRLLRGPHHAWFGDAALVARTWRASAASDRSGVRLEGDAVERVAGGPAEVAPIGLPVGAIQVPPDDRPIVLLADRPVTGGYPVAACVIGADVRRVAQLLPGDEAAFAWADETEALDALRHAEALLDGMEPAEPMDPLGGTRRPDDDLGWAGSLE